MTGQQIYAATTLVPVLVCVVAVPTAVGQRGAEPSGGVLEATVNRYCLGCHNDRTRTAGLTLAGVSAASVAARAPVLEKVLHKVRAGEMPPGGRPRPDATTVANLLKWLETELDRTAAVTVTTHTSTGTNVVAEVICCPVTAPVV